MGVSTFRVGTMRGKAKDPAATYSAHKHLPERCTVQRPYTRRTSEITARNGLQSAASRPSIIYMFTIPRVGRHVLAGGQQAHTHVITSDRDNWLAHVVPSKNREL